MRMCFPVKSPWFIKVPPADGPISIPNPVVRALDFPLTYSLNVS